MTEPVVHFEAPGTWEAAGAMVTFGLRVPRDTLGRPLEALRVHVRNHRRRLPLGDRSLEAYFRGFVFSQRRAEAKEARRLALETSYGPAPRNVRVGGHEGRAYELGPEVPPDDIDGRSPAVVTWHDGEMFFLVASGELEADDLLEVAKSVY